MSRWRAEDHCQLLAARKRTNPVQVRCRSWHDGDGVAVVVDDDDGDGNGDSDDDDDDDHHHHHHKVVWFLWLVASALEVVVAPVLLYCRCPSWRRCGEKQYG